MQNASQVQLESGVAAKMTTNAAPKNVNGHQEVVEIGVGTGAFHPKILHCVVVP